MVDEGGGGQQGEEGESSFARPLSLLTDGEEGRGEDEASFVFLLRSSLIRSAHAATLFSVEGDVAMSVTGTASHFLHLFHPQLP